MQGQIVGIGPLLQGALDAGPASAMVSLLQQLSPVRAAASGLLWSSVLLELSNAQE